MADFPDSTPVTEISRQIVEAEIDLLNWSGLSNSEGNEDREEDPSDDEPELGWTATQVRTGRYGWDDSNAYEPSLASTNSINQIHWWRGRMDDCEDEHDGREDCCEDEGAQCDDEGAVDSDREPDPEGDFSSCYMSREHSEATKEVAQALLDGLSERTKRHDQGLVAHSSTGLRGIVTRIY